MKHKFIETTEGKKKEIEVELERWVWGVLYKDGSEFHQFDDKGWFHQIKEINMDEVALFCMYKPDKMSTARYDVLLNADLKLVHFYRIIDVEQEDKSRKRAKIYAFGYENKKTGEISLNYILPDDRVVISNTKDIDLTRFNVI